MEREIIRHRMDLWVGSRREVKVISIDGDQITEGIVTHTHSGYDVSGKYLPVGKISRAETSKDGTDIVTMSKDYGARERK